jgi:hypothetical protein
MSIKRGVGFLGFRLFFYHKIISKKNLRRFKKNLFEILNIYHKEKNNYDELYDFLEGWISYSMHGDTYKLRKNILKKINEIMR